MPAQFQQAESLKTQYTDKYVVVKSEVPELRRFQGLTGVVKTVNMSGRALVMFDGPADIGWYDIDPSFLTVVDAPQPKKSEHKAVAKEAPATKATPAAKPAGGGEKKLSPLEMIRQQGAAGAKPAAAPAASAPRPAAAAGGAKPSPLDLIRQQGAAKSGAAASAPAAPAKAAAPPAGEGQKLSPIEMIRMQGAVKSGGAATPPQASAPPSPVSESVSAPPAAAAPKPVAPPADGKKLSPIEMIRQQGAFKGNK